MPGISDYFITQSLSSILASDTYLALSVNTIYPGMDGSAIAEPNPYEYPNYMRIRIPGGTWTPPTLMYLSNPGMEPESIELIAATNGGAIVFPTPPSSSTSLFVNYWALLDSAINGNLLFFSSTTPTLIGSSITPYFDIGEIIIGLQ